MDDGILFCGAAIQNDVRMLKCYGINIPGACDLHQQISNPTNNNPPGLYALSNAYIGTNLSKKDPNIAAIRPHGWGKVPLSYGQVNYAGLDARLGFEIARRVWQLDGYNSPSDRLNVVALEFFCNVIFLLFE